MLNMAWLMLSTMLCPLQLSTGSFPKPLSQQEHKTIEEVRTIYQAQHKIPCTACRYCVDGCLAGIPISDIFAL